MSLGSLPADVLWALFVTHSFLPHGRPLRRNECVTNELQRTSAGRLGLGTPVVEPLLNGHLGGRKKVEVTVSGGLTVG